MNQLTPGQAVSIPFSAIDGTPDATPVVTVYAGPTLLGSASVSSAGGTRDYLAGYTLPSTGITDYTIISMRVNYSVSAVAIATEHLLIGEFVSYRRADAIETDTQDVQARIPAALVGGRMDASVGSLTAPSIAQIEAAFMNDADGQALLAAMSARIQTLFDGGTDVPVATLVSLIAAQITADHGTGSYLRNTEPATPNDISAQISSDIMDGNEDWPSAKASISAKVVTDIDAALGGSIRAAQSASETLTARIPSTLFAGMTSLARWLGLMSGKTADATTLTEMQATQAGAGFTNTTDSLEALRDRGDAAWASSSGGSVGDAGPGTTVRQFRVVDQAGKPIPAAETWITTDLAGQNQIAGVLFANDQGYVEYRLNPGTYYFWRVHQDFTFTNPEPFTIG